MGAEGMAFGLFGRMLEKRAEDLRPHLRPVGLGGLLQLGKLVGVEFEPGRFGK